MPRVANALTRKALHQAVKTILDEYMDLWDGQLGNLDITPHR